ncbi:MAG: hypothetical protein ABFS56_26325 [Pseudomonadota bacterium]
MAVKDAAGRMIVEETAKKANFSLNLPDTEPDSEYILTIKDKHHIYQKTLVFRVPPFPLEANEEQI